MDRAAAAKVQLAHLKATGAWPDGAASDTAAAVAGPAGAAESVNHAAAASVSGEAEPITNRRKRRMSLSDDGMEAAAVVLRRASVSLGPDLPAVPAEDVWWSVRGGGEGRACLPMGVRSAQQRVENGRDCGFFFGGWGWGAARAAAQTESDQLLSSHDQTEIARLRRVLARLQLAEQRLLESAVTFAYM